MCTPGMAIGDQLLVKVFKANGTCYRWWQTIVDEDEFFTAAQEFGYTNEFQDYCNAAAKEAVELANRWIPDAFPGMADINL